MAYQMNFQQVQQQKIEQRQEQEQKQEQVQKQEQRQVSRRAIEKAKLYEKDMEDLGEINEVEEVEEEDVPLPEDLEGSPYTFIEEDEDEYSSPKALPSLFSTPEGGVGKEKGKIPRIRIKREGTELVVEVPLWEKLARNCTYDESEFTLAWTLQEIGNLILDRYREFFEGKHQQITKIITQKEVMKELQNKGIKINKSNLSRLVNNAKLEAPDEKIYCLKDFIERATRQSGFVSDDDVINYIRLEKRRNPYSDSQIAELIKERKRLQCPTESLRVQVLRIRKRLGIPNKDERKKLYERDEDPLQHLKTTNNDKKGE